jgi:hypothetical protein
MDLISPAAPRNWFRMLGAGLRLGTRGYLAVLLFQFLTQFTVVTLVLLGGLFAAVLGGPAAPAVMALAALAAVVAAVIGYAACLGHLWDLGRDRGADAHAAFARAPRRGWKMFVAAVLYALAVLCGALLVVLPGVVLFVALNLGVPLAIVEDRGARDALDESWRLVAGHWWRTLATLLFVLGAPVGLGAAVFKLAPLEWALPVANALPLLLMPFVYGVQLALLGELQARAALETPAEAQRRASSFA